MSNPCETWWKWLPHELIIFTKFHEHWTKIVDYHQWAIFEHVLFFFAQTLFLHFFVTLYHLVIRYFRVESELAGWHSTEHISKVLIKIWHKSEMAIKNSPHVTFINNRARAKNSSVLHTYMTLVLRSIPPRLLTSFWTSKMFCPIFSKVWSRQHDIFF